MCGAGEGLEPHSLRTGGVAHPIETHAFSTRVIPVPNLVALGQTVRAYVKSPQNCGMLGPAPPLNWDGA